MIPRTVYTHRIVRIFAIAILLKADIFFTSFVYYIGPFSSFIFALIVTTYLSISNKKKSQFDTGKRFAFLLYLTLKLESSRFLSFGALSHSTVSWFASRHRGWLRAEAVTASSALLPAYGPVQVLALSANSDSRSPQRRNLGVYVTAGHLTTKKHI